MRMKALIAIISSLIIAALIFGIIAIVSTMDNNDTAPMTQPESTQHSSTPETASAGTDSVRQGNYISSSKVSGYTMKSAENRLHIYELYDNGHSELVQTVDINPNVLPEQDRMQLETGISTDSYEKICSLIEDFSS